MQYYNLLKIFTLNRKSNVVCDLKAVLRETYHKKYFDMVMR